MANLKQALHQAHEAEKAFTLARQFCLEPNTPTEEYLLAWSEQVLNQIRDFISTMEQEEKSSMSGIMIRFRNPYSEDVSESYGPFVGVSVFLVEDTLRINGHPQWPDGRDFATWFGTQGGWRIHGIPEEPKVEVYEEDAKKAWPCVDIYPAS